MPNIGIVSVSQQYLVRVLGYKDARLISVVKDNEHSYNMVKFTLEHPSMPEAQDGDYLTVQDTVTIRER